MNNAACAIRVADNLGTMPNVHCLGNRFGIRLSRTRYVAGGLQIELSTLAQQPCLKHAPSSGKKCFCDLFRIRVSSTKPTATFTTQFLR